MVAVVQDLVVEQGATFEFVVDLLGPTGQPRTDLAGYAGALQIRESQDVASPLLAEATVTIDSANAQAVATIADTVTATYDWDAGWYDLRMDGPTRSERVARGRATLSRAVTD